MSDSTVFILDPTARAQAVGLQLASRPTDLEHSAVGFLDNGWWSFGVLIGRYRQLLAARFGVDDFIHRKKKTSSPAPKDVFEELAGKCKVVVNGLGN